MLNHQINYGPAEEAASCEGLQEFSIYKVTSLLETWDERSMYDTDAEVLQPIHSHYHQFPHTHTDGSSKQIKSEPMAELLPVHSESNRYDAWQSKFIDLWDSHDCYFWFIDEIHDLKKDQSLPELQLEAMARLDGAALKDMTKEAFIQRFPDYGDQMYERLQKVKSSFMHNSYYAVEWNTPSRRADETFLRYQQTQHMPQDPHTLTYLDSERSAPLSSSNTSLNSNSSSQQFGYNCSSEVESGYKSEEIVEEEKEELEPPKPKKRGPGRPRGTRKKKKPEKLGRLWEFIRDLLLNPAYNPSLICWEDYEKGMFRFVHSDRVAKLWGSKKENGDMNYEKLSRAMRYYYKSQVLLPVYGKRLVYKFGPTATGWRSERPIFR